MEEDWFLYSVTLFTFAVIFGLCYIRRKYTFFERNRMFSAPKPRFPFGNVQDVVFHKTAFFMLLWKFHNRFKRKQCKSGGFYVFLKPAVVLVDSELIETTLYQNNVYIEELQDKDLNDFSDRLREIMLSAVFGNFQKSWPPLMNCVITEEANFTDILNCYVVEVAAKNFFCLKSSSVLEKVLSKETNTYNFRKLAELSYPSLFSKSNDYDYFRKEIEKVVNDRKKNDVREDDVLQALIDNYCPVQYIVEIMFNLTINLKRVANSILFVLYESSLNEEIQNELREEILRFGKNNITNLEELNKLSYLKTTVLETFRKYPLRPFLCKLCKTGYNRDHLTFTDDVLLFTSVFAIHHDPQHYDNPGIFDPNRFSEENVKYINLTKYVPNGAKNMLTFESRYIIMIMKLMLIEIFTNAKISLGKKSPLSLRFDEASFELKPKDEMWFKVEKME